MKQHRYAYNRFLFVIFVSLIFPLSLQAATIEDFQTWANITATGSFAPLGDQWKNVRWWLEGQGRFGNDASRFSQGMIRPGIGYALNDHASVWLGYAWIPTEEPFTTNPFDEHRIWQQFLWTSPTSFGTFTSRSRLEERFASSGSDVGLRYRQLFKLSYPLNFVPNFSLVVSDEVFVNLKDANWGPISGFDQNRAFGGIGYNFTKNIKTEVGYMNQFINRFSKPDRMDHILSLNLSLTFP